MIDDQIEAAARNAIAAAAAAVGGARAWGRTHPEARREAVAYRIIMQALESTTVAEARRIMRSADALMGERS